MDLEGKAEKVAEGVDKASCNGPADQVDAAVLEVVAAWS